MRKGRWKLHVAHEYLEVAAGTGQDGKPSNWGKMNPLSIENSGIAGIASRHGYRVENLPQTLFDLDSDPAESQDVAASHPDIVKDLLSLADRFRNELGDSLTRITGSGQRSAGMVAADAK